MAAANPLNFNDFIQLIRNGEPLAAGVVNRPIGAIDERTRYLWDVLQASFIGSTVFARQVTTAADVLVGEPVYWNTANQRFERAIAGVEFDAATSGLVTSPAGQAWGVVYRKIDATLCDLLLFGYAKLDITAALETGETLKASTYYLSRTQAGKLVSGRPPIAVPILRTAGNGYVFVTPAWGDCGGQSPLRFRLHATPAGTHVPTGSGSNVITNPNANVKGWLPADHESFGGKAPHDAKFGYNLAADASLLASWPPLPPGNAILFKDGALVPDMANTGDGGLVRFDRNGIWWMSDCYGSCPFPDSIDTDFTVVSESASESIPPNDCPHTTPMRLDLFFSRLDFLTDQTVVTSLTTKDERISIFCENGDPDSPAHVGPLEIKLNLEFLSDNEDPGGYLAIKSWDATAGKFHRGPVATGVYSLNDAVVLTSDFQTTEEIDDEDRTVHHGRIGIDLNTDDDREIFPDLVRLGSDGATEEYVNDVMYLGFPAGEQTSLRLRFQVPATLSLVNPKLALRVRMMGLASGAVPNLTATYRRVPAASVATALPTSDSAMTIATGFTAASAKQYIDKAGTAVTVAAGDIVFVTLTRSASDGYAGEVGLLRASGVLSAS